MVQKNQNIKLEKKKKKPKKQNIAFWPINQQWAWPFKILTKLQFSKNKSVYCVKTSCHHAVNCLTDKVRLVHASV